MCFEHHVRQEAARVLGVREDRGIRHRRRLRVEREQGTFGVRRVPVELGEAGVALDASVCADVDPFDSPSVCRWGGGFPGLDDVSVGEARDARTSSEVFKVKASWGVLSVGVLRLVMADTSIRPRSTLTGRSFLGTNEARRAMSTSALSCRPPRTFSHARSDAGPSSPICRPVATKSAVPISPSSAWTCPPRRRSWRARSACPRA